MDEEVMNRIYEFSKPVKLESDSFEFPRKVYDARAENAKIVRDFVPDSRQDNGSLYSRGEPGDC